MKISKAAWMIVGAGGFVIILAGLGMTWSGQQKEQARINEEYLLTQTRIAKPDAGQNQTRITELEQQLSGAVNRLADAKKSLKQTVISVDVADKFYEIADYYGVTVSSMGTTGNSYQAYENVGCKTISLSAAVSGDTNQILGFIAGLNEKFVTGFVQSSQINIGAPSDNGTVSRTTAGIQMVIYTYKEAENGQ